jgi:hypothetical protein
MVEVVVTAAARESGRAAIKTAPRLEMRRCLGVTCMANSLPRSLARKGLKYETNADVKKPGVRTRSITLYA